MAPETELLELERRQLSAFTDWDQVHQLSTSIPMAHRPGIGVLARLPGLRQILQWMQRVRYAGVLADRQRELNLIALERASLLTQLLDVRTASIDQRLAEVNQRAESARELAAVVHRDVGQAMIEVHDRIDTTTSYVTYQWGELRAEFFELDENTRTRLARSEARLDDQERRYEDLEERSHLQASHLRRLEQSRTVGSGENPATNSQHPLAGDLLPRLIALLEQQFPELTRARQVGVSIQDGAADDMIAIQAAYFGERLGMYGTRDDAWYHVDFTPEWNRAILFDNALSKLAPGGNFVLISDPRNVDRMEVRPLAKVLSQVVDITPTVQASVHIWRRPTDNGSHG